ncbi:hypothetical protein EYC08_17600 [Tabrizicola sp. WMC-M-20]|nr:hypothetical protein EYC08_17600 [Tabrizicola sp. WMC-M-20]
MSDSQTTAFAFLVESSELCRLVPDWPAAIHLALCPDADGTCALLVFHQDEDAPRVIARIGAHLGLAPGHFDVIPELDGYPTRRIPFSDEQRLIGLAVGDASTLRGVRELAQDYAINYAFAAEEGLDPDDLTGGLTSVQPEHGPSHARPDHPAPATAPTGFTQLTGKDSYHVARAEMSLTASGEVCITLEAGEASTTPGRADRVFVRDDLEALALLAADVTQDGLIAARITIAPDHLPEPMLQALTKRPMLVRLTRHAAHVFVLPAPERPRLAAPAPVARPAAPFQIAAGLRVAVQNPVRMLRLSLRNAAAALGLSAALAVALHAAVTPGPKVSVANTDTIGALRHSLFPKP